MSSKTKTTATEEATTPALVPKLRFPEFRGKDGWECRQLVDVCAKVTQGGTPDTSKPEYWGGTINWMTPAEMGKTESPFIGSTNRTITELGLGDCASDLLPLNTVILSVRAPIGHLAINTVPMAINQGCKGLIPGKSLDFYFLFSSLLEAKTRLIDLGAGNTFKELSGSALKSFHIPVPSPAEQQKIAECLSSVDELLAAQARKVDALKTHKKGLMQQLFPREGETQPRLRFPEFQNAGEWEEQPLKKVFSVFQGFAFSSGDSAEQGCRWLKIADVGIQVMNHEAPSFLPEAYKERFSKFAVRAGDYVVALTRPILSGQLKIAKVDNVFDGALLNQRVGKLITSQHPTFVFLLLQTNKLIGEIERSISGNDPPNLSAQQIEGIKTYVPLPAEQQRIASCLSSLDALITAETQKHEALKTHKKGLMQQLFPSPEEVEE